MNNKKQNTNTTLVQPLDVHIMERVRALERNNKIQAHIIRMKHTGYTEKQCRIWLFKIAVLSDFMDVFNRFLVD